MACHKELCISADRPDAVVVECDGTGPSDCGFRTGEYPSLTFTDLLQIELEHRDGLPHDAARIWRR